MRTWFNLPAFLSRIKATRSQFRFTRNLDSKWPASPHFLQRRMPSDPGLFSSSPASSEHLRLGDWESEPLTSEVRSCSLHQLGPLWDFSISSFEVLLLLLTERRAFASGPQEVGTQQLHEYPCTRTPLNTFKSVHTPTPACSCRHRPPMNLLPWKKAFACSGLFFSCLEFLERGCPEGWGWGGPEKQQRHVERSQFVLKSTDG